MNTHVYAATLQARVAELEKKLKDAMGVVSILYQALDDASTVVDAGDDEVFAYQAELAAGAALLGIVVESAQRLTDELVVLVVVTGVATEADDESIPGTYAIEVSLARSVRALALSAGDAGAIAKAVLDEFHDRHGINTLDDFEITAQIEGGPVITEMEDESMHTSDLVVNVNHLGKVERTEQQEEVSG